MTKGAPEIKDWLACFLDLQFWLALGLGPVIWFGLWWLGLDKNLGLSVPLKTLVLFAIVYPLLEEIVFRGMLQGWLLGLSAVKSIKLLPGVSLANVITSVVFALLHLLNQSPLWAASVFFPSLVFGWSRERYGNITGSIALHSFYNAGFLLMFG